MSTTTEIINRLPYPLAIRLLKLLKKLDSGTASGGTGSPATTDASKLTSGTLPDERLSNNIQRVQQGKSMLANTEIARLAEMKVFKVFTAAEWAAMTTEQKAAVEIALVEKPIV